ncbi:MAG TPA: cytochrome C, partial [Nitrospirota bacterium]
ATSPGGNYPVASLSCISCHDPHSAARQTDGVLSYRIVGQSSMPIEGSGSYNDSSTVETVGVFRFLGGAGYAPVSAGTGFTPFTADPPFAVVNKTYNRTEAATDTRVAYGSGMSEWCANCHASILNNNPDTTTTHRHPSGSLAVLNATNEGALYDAYVKTGDMSGNGTAAFTSLVPFEMGLGRVAGNMAKLQSYAVNDGTKMGGVADAIAAGGTPNVMCLSCHRAHASAFPYALRFGATGGEFITGADNAYAGYDSTDAEGSNSRINYGYNQAQMAAAYYDRPATKFAPTQRVLCNKCHAKD